MQVEGLYQVHIDDHIIVTAGYFWCAVPDQLKLGYEHIAKLHGWHIVKQHTLRK